MRGVGDPLALARGVIAAVKVTSTPLPQSAPAHPTTPLPVARLARILGGSATVGSDGVVTVDVPRRDRIILGGVPINPFLNVAAPISFEPLNSSGMLAAVVPDFNMVASEIQNVIGVMRQQGWVIGCLYNQETDEQPQLYFSHQLKVGDPLTLAQEIRKGLDRMNVMYAGLPQPTRSVGSRRVLAQKSDRRGPATAVGQGYPGGRRCRWPGGPVVRCALAVRRRRALTPWPSVAGACRWPFSDIQLVADMSEIGVPHAPLGPRRCTGR